MFFFKFGDRLQCCLLWHALRRPFIRSEHSANIWDVWPEAGQVTQEWGAEFNGAALWRDIVV